jgi:hypothetical protein
MTDQHPIDVPADGTMSPELEGDGTGDALPPAPESVTLDIHDSRIDQSSPTVE